MCRVIIGKNINQGYESGFVPFSFKAFCDAEFPFSFRIKGKLWEITTDIFALFTLPTLVKACLEHLSTFSKDSQKICMSNGLVLM